jgi:hypothetical protein
MALAAYDRAAASRSSISRTTCSIMTIGFSNRSSTLWMLARIKSEQRVKIRMIPPFCEDGATLPKYQPHALGVINQKKMC